MALVVDTAVSRHKDSLETAKTAAVYSNYGPQGTRHFGVFSALCTSHQGEDDLDLAAMVADEIKQAHLSAPEYLQINKVIEQDLFNANRSVRSHVRGRPKLSVTIVNVNQRSWTVGHIGVNRAWLFRGARLQQLTSDHTIPSPSGPSLLQKACGISDTIEPDILTGNLEDDDILLITSPNVHNHLDGATIMSCLISDWPAKKIADEIGKRVNEKKVYDDIAVCVVRIGNLPRPETAVPSRTIMPKPGPLPEPEQVIDRFLIEKRLRKSRLSNYYKAIDTLNDANVLMKFPAPEFMTSKELVTAFINDEWLSRKQTSQMFVPGYPIARGRRSQLYSVYEYRHGENLARRLKRKEMLPLGEILLIGKQLLHVLENLHAQKLAHRDIRPENIVLDKRNKEIFLLGIDRQRIQHLIKLGSSATLKVISAQYLPPEIFERDDWGAQSDIYATGVSLYQMACGTFPYGRLKHPGDALKRKMKPAQKYNPDLPDKFVEILEKACTTVEGERYQSARQFAEALAEIRMEKTTPRRSFLRRTKSRR